MDVTLTTIFTTMFLSFITYFTTISPINGLIFYLRLTENYSEEKKKEVKNKSVLIASVILICATLIGPSGFKLLGIDIYSVKIAGGVVLAIVSIGMVFGEHKEVSSDQLNKKQKNITIVPLSMPIICGPAALVSTLVLFSEYHSYILKFIVLLMLVVNLLILHYLFSIANLITKYIKKSVINVLFILTGIILTALAVQFIINGIKDSGIINKVVYNSNSKQNISNLKNN